MSPFPERSNAERSQVKRFGVKGRLILIGVLYLLLTSTYSIVTPIGRGADEWAHYWYAQFIARNGRLPLNPTERESAGYKSDWPPLYHLSVAAVTAWIDTAGPPTFKYRADNIRRQIIPASSSEAILHTEDELFPWQQEILIWHLGRFLSIAFSLGTLWVTYRLALEVFEGNSECLLFSPLPSCSSAPLRALAATALLAFTPRFLFTGMLFNYDSLTLLVASLFLWLAIRIAKGYHSRWGFWGLGALAGLALLTKYLTALLPLEIIFLAFSSGAGGQRRRGEFKFVPLLNIGQAALAFLLVISPWLGYLLVNFNEIETYGPILGTVAPLLRGDGSDRTVEQIFTWVSGGEAPAPAHIEQQFYSAGQLITQFFVTFWANPINPSFLLGGFVAVMTLLLFGSIAGLFLWWRTTPAASPLRFWVSLLSLHCLLAVPFMAVRLFGARDALEAVQGRHILFLSGPAVAILLVYGLVYLASHLPLYASRFMLYGLTGLLLTGSALQLFSMWQGYPPPLPVQTTPLLSLNPTFPPASLKLPGGAAVIETRVKTVGSAVQVTIFWQGGAEPAPEDYQLELALIDSQGQTRTSWLGYQTQAHYPTRAWEAGDIIRDEGWLPLERLEMGDYEIRLRILGSEGPVVDWQALSTYRLNESASQRASESGEWILWRNGQNTLTILTLQERETAQFTFPNLQSPISSLQSPPSTLQLFDPHNVPHPPASAGETWANFIIGPDWPAGDYRWQPEGKVVLRVAPNERNFQQPSLAYPLETNFAGRVKLLGYDLPSRRVQPGEGLPVTLYWQGLRWMGEDFVIFERLLDNQGMAWGGYDRRAKENYSTLFWAPREIVTDGFAVPIDPAAPPGVYQLSLGWYQRVGEQAASLVILDQKTGQATDSTAITIGPIKVGGPPPGVTIAAVNPQTKLAVRLGEQIKLLGFDLAYQRVAFAPLHLILYWQALAVPTTDYTVFAHVRDADGQVVAQMDRPPAGGAYPTSLWDADEIIKDEITIPLEQLKPGQYEVVVGLYDFASGLRLPGAGSADGAIILQSFEVGE